MRNATKQLLLVCTALTALALASCEVIASTAGQDLSGETVWISLTPSVPAVDGKGVRTATLALDFSREISGLTSETSAEDLATIFKFDHPDGTADITVTGVEKVAAALYRLKVVNVPLSGIATVTVNRPGITPPSRLWSVDGRMIPDNELPVITAFRFTQSENISLSEPEAVGSIDQTAGKIVVVAPEGTSLSALIPTVSTSADSDFSPKGAQDFSNPIQYTVTAATTGALRDYEVTVYVQTSSSASIELFQFLAGNNAPNLTKDVSAIITGSSITVTVPYGTALGALTPTITYLGASISPENGVAADFRNSESNPVRWTVTSTDGTTQADYWVTATVNAWASAPSIALAPGNGELGYTIASDPSADSYDVYWIAGNETSAAAIKSGGTRIAGAATTGTISGLINEAPYSFIVTAHKADYADCDSEIVSDMPVGPLANAERRFVKVGGAGNGSGTSWEDASGNIQSMMDELTSGGGEVWVAAGKYTPGNTRDSSFALRGNVKVYGGFPAGITTATLLELAMRNRNALFNTDGTVKDATCETILSGDIDNNDTYAAGTGLLTTNYEENAKHVVLGANDAVLDGFTVKGGYADGSSGSVGGGIYDAWAVSPTLSNLTITGNCASRAGGGIYNERSSPILTNATIAGNGAQYGGGIFNDKSSSTFINVVVAGNSGAGIFNDDECPGITLINVLIAGNSGYGVDNQYSSVLVLVNVTIAGNTSSGISLYRAGAESHNSIIWGNEPNIALWDRGSISLSNSLVGDSAWNNAWGGDQGSSLVSTTDPFAGSQPYSAAPTIAGDYRLGSSMGVNAGSDTLYYDRSTPSGWAATGLNWAETLTKDLSGAPRKVGDHIDMGAYEKQ